MASGALPVEAALSSDVLTTGSWLCGAVRIGESHSESVAMNPPRVERSGSRGVRRHVAWVVAQAFGVVSADPSWLSLPKQSVKVSPALNVPPGPISSRNAEPKRGHAVLGAVVVPPGATSGRALSQTPPSESEVGSPSGEGLRTSASEGRGVARGETATGPAPQVIAEIAKHGDVSQHMRGEWEKKFGRDYAKQQQFIFATPCVLLGHTITLVNDASPSDGTGQGTFSADGARDGEVHDSLSEQRACATFDFAMRLPYTLPPSFYGCGLRYRYFVCLSVAVHKSATPRPSVPPEVSTFSIPFRVVNPTSAVRRTVFRPMLPETFDFAVRGRFLDRFQRDDGMRSSLRKPDTEPQYSTPRRDQQRLRHRRRSSEYEELQLEHDMVQSLSAVAQVMEKHAHPVTAAIRRTRAESSSAAAPDGINPSDLVATVSLSRTSFTLGDAIEGVVHFPSALGGHFALNRDENGDSGTQPFANVVPAARCYQLTIRLEVEETLDRRFASRRRGLKPHIRCVAEQHELVESCAFTTFALHIPAESTPEMMTELVSVRWLLHFEFVVSPAIQLTDNHIRAAVDDHLKKQESSRVDGRGSSENLLGSLRHSASDASSTLTTPRATGADRVVVVKPSRPNVGRPDTEPLHWSLPVRVLVAELPAQPIVPKRNVWRLGE